LEDAKPAGWRFLVADRDRVVASAELADDSGNAPSINSGPYVSATATAIDDLERLPEIADGDFELRILKVPGLYVVAAWLVGGRRVVVPLAPAPSFLEAGRSYSEEEFMKALAEPARKVLGQPPGASGG
jgi:hypothetical protein